MRLFAMALCRIHSIFTNAPDFAQLIQNRLAIGNGAYEIGQALADDLLGEWFYRTLKMKVINLVD